MQQAVDDLETALGREFDTAPAGTDPALGSRSRADSRRPGPGRDRRRSCTIRRPRTGLRAFAGTAPITSASGRSHYVKARKVRNKRLGDACHWWAFATLTKSAGARAHYDKRRAAGDHHNAALRNLANKLLGRLWWCLQHNEPWDDHAAWPDHDTERNRRPLDN